MKLKTLLLLTVLVAFFLINIKSVSAAGISVCSFPRGGYPYAGYGAVCLDPSDYADAISALPDGSTNLGICQVLQDDNQMSSGIYKYTSKGPRGVTCTLVERVTSTNIIDSCSCSDGSACVEDDIAENGEGDISNLYSVNPWNFAECSKCNNSDFSANWNQESGSVVINVSADNRRPILQNKCILYCGGNSGEPRWETNVVFPDSYLDFKFQIFESGNTAPIKEQNVFPDSATPTNMNCVYHTNDSWGTWGPDRDPLNHYTTCTISNYQIAGLSFQQGKTYSVKTLIKAHYGDDTQWMDYVPVGIQTDKNYDICNSSLTIESQPLQCEDLTSAESVSSIQLGDSINLTCSKNASYLNAVTYNFRSIQKPNAASANPNPLPTPFVANSAAATVPYQLPTNQYGYYLFQCQVCAGSFCTAWQNP